MRALIACGYSTQHWDEVPPEGRRLVESLSTTLPEYRLPQAALGHSRHYMPTAKMKDGREETTLVLDAFADVSGHGGVWVRWRTKVDEEAQQLFDVLVTHLGYLGRSESWVLGESAPDDAPLPQTGRAFPHSDGVRPGRSFEQIALSVPDIPDADATWRGGEVEAAIKGEQLEPGVGGQRDVRELQRQITIDLGAQIAFCFVSRLVAFRLAAEDMVGACGCPQRKASFYFNCPLSYKGNVVSGLVGYGGLRSSFGRYGRAELHPAFGGTMPLVKSSAGSLEKPGRWAAAIFSAWAVITILSAAQGNIAQSTAGAPEPWMRSFVYAATVYMTWALLTPLVLLVAALADNEARRPLRVLAVHLPVGVVLAAVHSAVYMSIFWRLYPDTYGILSNPSIFAQKIITNLHVDLMIYALIVGVFMAGRAYRSLRARELDAAKLETRLAEAEVAALRAQLQPHFLFNALNAICALVRTNPLQAERLVATLGDLLRLSIDNRRGQECLLSDELDFVSAYLEIEQIRLGDRLQVVRRIDACALTARLPSILLQPLAENAVRHGVGPLDGQGVILIEASLADGALHLTVKDNGVGAGRLVERVGLGACRKRIEQLYGDRGAMQIRTAPGEGFDVRLRIPQ